MLPSRREMIQLLIAVPMSVAADGVLTGCAKRPSDDQPGQGHLDKIVVGRLLIADVAAAQIAEERDYFRDERLQVEFQTISNLGAAAPSLLTGAMDFALGNYVTAVLAGYQSAKAEKPLGLWFVADAYSAAPHLFSGWSPPARPSSTPATSRAARSRSSGPDPTSPSWRYACSSAWPEWTTTTSRWSTRRFR